MEKLPPHIREKVHAVVYEGWPKEEDLMTVEGKPNQTQALIEEYGKTVRAQLAARNFGRIVLRQMYFCPCHHDVSPFMYIHYSASFPHCNVT